MNTILALTPWAKIIYETNFYSLRYIVVSLNRFISQPTIFHSFKC